MWYPTQAKIRLEWGTQRFSFVDSVPPLQLRSGQSLLSFLTNKPLLRATLLSTHPWTFLMKRNSVVMFFCLAACSVAIAQTKRALLIGIDTYEPPGTRVKVPAGTPAEG